MVLVLSLLIIVGGVFWFASCNGGKAMITHNVNRKVLVAYFSRTGEQYGVGNITEGNTAIVAKIIANKIGGDLLEIRVLDDRYPKRYNELTEYAKKEKQGNVRPAIIGEVENFEDYDTVFIGYPNWWADVPMPVRTFLESYDFSNKKVAPFCTHEGSGFGGTSNIIKNITKARLLNGLAIYGHVAQNDRDQAEKQVSEWLQRLGF